MSKIDASPIVVGNYLLEARIERETAHYADGTDFVWRYDQRMKIVEPLIRETAKFGVELIERVRSPSLLDEDELVMGCLEGKYSYIQAASWAFTYLFEHAISQASATYALFATSFVSSGFQLWRSLFESHVICEFLNKNLSNSILLQDFISHTLLLSWIRMKDDANALCRTNGTNDIYDSRQIIVLKELYQSRGWKLSDEYAWARSAFEGKKCTFRDIRNQVSSDMSLFYRIASREIHPTLGQRFALLDTHLPLPAVPINSVSVVDYQEAQLDFLTANVLDRVTLRVDSFCTLDDDLADRLNLLKELGRKVLETRKGSKSPILNCVGQTVVRGRRA